MISRLLLLVHRGCLALLIAQLPQQAEAQAPHSAPGGVIKRSDGRALDRIFAGQHLPESALTVHRRARAMQPESRLTFLSRWVLPGEDHAGFRLTIGFEPLDQSPEKRSNHEIALGAAGSSSSLYLSAPVGGRIVSPALDLIATAAELGRLPSLQESLLAAEPLDVAHEIERLAMQALVAVEAEDTTRAAPLLEQMFAHALTDPATLHRSRDAALLCLHVATRSPPLAQIVFDPAQRIAQQYLTVYNRQAWEQHLTATVAVLKEIVEGEKLAAKATAFEGAPQWAAVARSRAFEHGTGFPAPLWRLAPTSVRNLSSHGDDFLFFKIPLQGSYSVEAEVTEFNWQDSQLMVAGTWVAPIHGHRVYGVGNVRGEQARIAIAPPLSNLSRPAPIHYRTAVGATQATTYFNGRQIHTQSLNSIQDPWIAIRSSYRRDGGADDLRISGTPTVPDTISLSESPDLLGWYEYYRRPDRDELVDWRYQPAATGSGLPTEAALGEIVGPQRPELPRGSHAESLLVYTRPLWEDGTLEYEFWYVPSQSVVHPVLGRTCFLLRPDGMAVHPITDGPYEQFSRRPDAILDEPQNRRGPSTLPLLSGSWNRMMLSLVGNQVTLQLNGQKVYEHEVESGTPRTFGLFHYADREEARVRQVRWSGNWPKQLPVLSEQQLASSEPALLEDRSQALAAEFFEAFNEDTFSSRRMKVVEGDPAKHFFATSEGLTVRRPAEVGYRNAMLSPHIEISGDFDVTVRFDQLESHSLPDMTATIMLNVAASNNANDIGSLQRKRDRQGDQVTQCLYMQTIADSERRHYFNHRGVEATSGRLRLSRRGDQLFYQFAENDSDQFRIVGRADFSTADLTGPAIRFGAQIQGSTGYTHVRFRDFHARAERMQGMALDSMKSKLADLNQSRAKLRANFHHDFARTSPSANDLFRWNADRQWNQADGGLMIQAVGTEEWTSSGLSLLRQIEGDFDIKIEFDPRQLAIPAAGQETAIYLQAELTDAARTQVNSTLARMPSGTVVANAKLRASLHSGEFQYRSLGAIEMASVKQLRLARRSGRIYWIAGSETGGDETIIASADIGDAAIDFGGLRALVHTGGEGRSSEVLLRSLGVNAERISDRSSAGAAQQQRQPALAAPPAANQPNGNAPAQRPKSLFQSLFDLF